MVSTLKSTSGSVGVLRIKGGKTAVANMHQHIQADENAGLGDEQLELAPVKLMALSQILAREKGTTYFGTSKEAFTNITTGEQVQGAIQQKIDWLSEGVGVGENVTGGYGIILTVPKELSLLAGADWNIRGIVEEALKAGGEAYLKSFRENAVVRVVREKVENKIHIDPESLRGFSTIHRASAAGDPHFHTHILLGGCGVAEDEKDQENPIRRSIWSLPVMIGENRIINVAGNAARMAILTTLLDKGIAADPLSNGFICDELAREKIATLSKMRELITTILEDGFVQDDEKARVLARQQMQSGGDGGAKPGWLGKQLKQVFDSVMNGYLRRKN